MVTFFPVWSNWALPLSTPDTGELVTSLEKFDASYSSPRNPSGLWVAPSGLLSLPFTVQKDNPVGQVSEVKIRIVLLTALLSSLAKWTERVSGKHELGKLTLNRHCCFICLGLINTNFLSTSKIFFLHSLFAIPFLRISVFFVGQKPGNMQNELKTYQTFLSIQYFCFFSNIDVLQCSFTCKL